jgi:hypothetical protein
LIANTSVIVSVAALLTADTGMLSGLKIFAATSYPSSELETITV